MAKKKEQEKERKKRFANDNRIKQIAKDCLKSELLGHEKYYRRALSVGGFDLSKYSEADVKSLVACVKSAAVRLRKLNSDFQKPEVLRKPNNYRIKLVDVSKVLKTNLTKLNEKWQKIILEGGSELDDLEQQIETTDLMQLKIGGNFERLFDCPMDAKKFKVSLLAFFRKFKKDLSGVLHSKLLMSIIYNHGDEVIVQDPHRDFGFKQVMDTKEKLAWTANIPISQDGSYIILWNGPGYGSSIHIPFGKCLLLRSDVVHAGGRPDWTGIASKIFLRMHFYLPTSFMPADPENVFPIDTDGKELKEHYLF